MTLQIPYVQGGDIKYTHVKRLHQTLFSIIYNLLTATTLLFFHISNGSVGINYLLLFKPTTAGINPSSLTFELEKVLDKQANVTY